MMSRYSYRRGGDCGEASDRTAFRTRQADRHCCWSGILPHHPLETKSGSYIHDGSPPGYHDWAFRTRARILQRQAKARRDAAKDATTPSPAPSRALSVEPIDVADDEIDDGVSAREAIEPHVPDVDIS